MSALPRQTKEKEGLIPMAIKTTMDKFNDRYELAKAHAMAGEIEGGQTTVEYVIVVAIVLGLAAMLIAFRQELGNMVNNAANYRSRLFMKSSTNGSF